MQREADAHWVGMSVTIPGRVGDGLSATRRKRWSGLTLLATLAVGTAAAAGTSPDEAPRPLDARAGPPFMLAVDFEVPTPGPIAKPIATIYLPGATLSDSGHGRQVGHASVRLNTPRGVLVTSGPLVARSRYSPKPFSCGIGMDVLWRLQLPRQSALLLAVSRLPRERPTKVYVWNCGHVGVLFLEGATLQRLRLTTPHIRLAARRPTLIRVGYGHMIDFGLPGAEAEARLLVPRPVRVTLSRPRDRLLGGRVTEAGVGVSGATVRIYRKGRARKLVALTRTRRGGTFIVRIPSTVNVVFFATATIPLRDATATLCSPPPDYGPCFSGTRAGATARSDAIRIPVAR